MIRTTLGALAAGLLALTTLALPPSAEPAPGYESLAGHVSFYPAHMDACLVDGELVAAQPGGFYGGWITHDVVGPFKGGPGSEDW